MKIKHKIYYTLVTIVTLFSSCEKMVDAGDPLTTVTSEKTFSHDGTAYAALAGLYSQMINGSSNQLSFSNGAMTLFPGMSSDELVGYLGVANQTDYNFSINNLDSRNSIVKQTFWTPMYKLIFNANAIIEGVNASTSNQLTLGARKQIVAEAKFIRAFSYFYLVNLFGDLPLVINTDWKQNTQLSRSSVKDVYALIVDDLLLAERDLPEDYQISAQQRIRVNKFAAKALLSRVYLYLQDWKNAEIKAGEIIADKQFIIEPKLGDVFRSTSKEAIWQLKPSVSKPTFKFSEVLSFTPDLWWKDVPIAQRPLYLDQSVFPQYAFVFYPDYIFTQQQSSAFETGDKRIETWTSFIETPTFAPYTGVTDYFPIKYVENSSPGVKYLTVFRLAEQRLIRAEARAHLNDLSNADDDINAIRERAGLEKIVSTSQAAALDAIAKERRTELFAEWGHRWFDLKRTGKALDFLGQIPQKKSDPNQLLYPIPFDEVQAGPALIQNPGY